jgi:hypothetical protein
MAENDSEDDAVDKALRILVYAPVGLACYLKDSAPTFIDVFVSRGRREVEGAKRVVEEKLGLRTPPPAPAPSPSVQKRFADGFGKVASQAGTVAAAVAGSVVNAASPPPNATGSPTDESTGVSGSGGGATAGPATAGAATELPIAGYDGLSASQIIERLDGLSRGALERIRLYEIAHRARRTILASIDQLTA